MNFRLRWGAPVYRWQSPEEWVARHRELGLRAAYWPDVPANEVTAYVRAAQNADLVVAEVGAWSNPLALDPADRDQALKLCVERLALADEVGARCCVNIAGSRADQWDGPCGENFSSVTFDQIVETVRSIVDAAAPRRTFYTLELMPWVWPWDADSYLKLLHAIDRPRFAVHLDPANTIVSPQLFYGSAAVYRELFSKLGPWIRSCHVKDIARLPGFPSHLQEVPLLTGGLDLAEYVRQVVAFDPELPLMLEHLPNEAAYRGALERLHAADLGA